MLHVAPTVLYGPKSIEISSKKRVSSRISKNSLVQRSLYVSRTNKFSKEGCVFSMIRVSTAPFGIWSNNHAPHFTAHKNDDSKKPTNPVVNFQALCIFHILYHPHLVVWRPRAFSKLFSLFVSGLMLACSDLHHIHVLVMLKNAK